ncbi:MAG: hypothetical protein PHD25_05450 [Bacteroidales bacterium]|nr:hypothetical protein [Bacteroidales bacterium]
MEAMIKIKPSELVKLQEAIRLSNQLKRCSLELLEVQGSDIRILYQDPRELFILGRIFQPLKLPLQAGSIQIELDNSFIQTI